MDVSHQEIYRLFKLYDPPARIKQASEEELSLPTKPLSLHLYADIDNKTYPTHTAAATWLSAASFLEKQAEYAPKKAATIANRLERSAKYFGLGEEFQSLITKVAKATSENLDELADEDLAFVYRQGDTVERRFPLRNTGEVKAAADYLDTHRKQFPYAIRKVMAEKIMAKAASLAVDLEEDRKEMLRKVAGQGTCLVKTAVSAVRQRADSLTTRHERLANLLRETAADIEKLASLPTAQRDKLANLLDEVDRTARLNLIPAEDFLYGADFEKMASDAVADHFALPNGAIFHRQAMAAVPIAAWRDLYGDKFATDISLGGLLLEDKLASELKALDRLNSDLAENLFREHGANPVHRERVTYTFNPEEVIGLVEGTTGA